VAQRWRAELSQWQCIHDFQICLLQVTIDPDLPSVELPEDEDNDDESTQNGAEEL